MDYCNIFSWFCSKSNGASNAEEVFDTSMVEAKGIRSNRSTNKERSKLSSQELLIKKQGRRQFMRQHSLKIVIKDKNTDPMQQYYLDSQLIKSV